jgi:hypothetical protein
MNLITNSFISILLLASAAFSAATTVNQIGAYAFWPTVWSPVLINDGKDYTSDGPLDLVGDINNGCLSYASDSSYVYFRMRVDAPTFTVGQLAGESHGAYNLLIDVNGYGNTGVDYGFSWDTKSNNSTNHGLEMEVAGVNGTTWQQTRLDDIDGNGGSKGTNDINGNDRSTDGYVRTTDAQATTNLGNTTLIDFAVKWSYLESYTNLRPGQTWQVALSTIHDATDNNAFNADVLGAALTDNISTGWSSGFAPVPEPGTALAGLLLAAGLLRRRR